MEKAAEAMGRNLRKFKNIRFFKELFLKSCSDAHRSPSHKSKKCAPFYGRALTPHPHIWEGLSENRAFTQVLGDLGEFPRARVPGVFAAKVARGRACA